MTPNHVYMAVTSDDYELPIAVGDTVVELAKMVGATTSNIYSQISKGTSGKFTGMKFIKVLLS